MQPTRRKVLKGLVATAVLGTISGCASAGVGTSRVVVVGGGFAGLSAARTLKALDPSIEVTLVEPKKQYVACPFSNLVVAGERDIASQTFGYNKAVEQGIVHVPLAAKMIDPISRQILFENHPSLTYDRLILAPGVSLHYAALEGYSEQAAIKMPHAWQAGEQTLLLRHQLEAMPNGGLVTIVAPPNPYRCPPGPYERASLIAHYLKRAKPKSKVLILDSKDRFSKQSLFEAAWQSEYGEMIEWQGLSDGARVIAVNSDNNTLMTDFDTVEADVANVIPPQRAGRIALDSGMTDESGWCPVDALSFESTLAPLVHVIGDAAILNAMPKSAFAANAQAKLCAVQVIRLLAGKAPLETTLLNTCYSLVAPRYGISVAGVYRADGVSWRGVEGAGGTSDADAPVSTRQQEADYARGWFDTISREVFG
ncbi:MAG: NADPH-dependent 2,4-dienoyl-CoA reductase/sulfur reductase-like enzyme [Candidatus Azotimanducaceae bacterium]|jgi:sulfide dehydrogenase [flavocytochrome c] flavoprotein subunit